jgi:pantoate--beta-alanine ligase
MLIVRTVDALRAALGPLRREGARIGLAPTMGALHEGHLSLVGALRPHVDLVVVTIFVNPTQFAANEDFSRYPRPFERDAQMLRGAGVEILFAPDVAQMYPPGDATRIEPGGPALAGLEDRARPGHFAGVATVVAKLLLQALPDRAIFGEKDWQQLCVIRRVVTDLMILVTIDGAPTLRAADGLALSSRNAYLSAEERAKAPILAETLRLTAARIEAGEDGTRAEETAVARLAEAGFAVDYVALRDAEHLGRLAPGRAGRLLAAARLGATRLIDNLAVRPPLR